MNLGSLLTNLTNTCCTAINSVPLCMYCSTLLHIRFKRRRGLVYTPIETPTDEISLKTIEHKRPSQLLTDITYNPVPGGDVIILEEAA
jgi:hypothetical protein